MESTGTETVQVGLLDTLKEKLNPSTLMARLNLNQETLLAIILYLGLGFVVGFLLKRYSNALFIILGCAVVLIFAQQFELLNITVYWNKIQTILGYQQLEPVEGSLVSAYWLWMKTNIVLVVSFAIGFLFGIHLG